MKYCFNCKEANSWPGGFMTFPVGPCEAPGHVGDRNVPCYDYDSRLLPGMPQEMNAIADREEEGV